MEILTIAELAAMLKMNKRQIYSMTDSRTRAGSMKANPLPVLKINGNIRFRKSDIEASCQPEMTWHLHCYNLALWQARFHKEQSAQ